MNLQEIRKKYPQYQDMSDDALAEGLHKKYYSDMDYGEFSYKISHVPEAVKPQLEQALAVPSQGYPARGTSTLIPEQKPEQPIDKLTREFKEKESAPVTSFGKTLVEGAKDVGRGALDFMQMQDDVTQAANERRGPHEQTERRYGVVASQSLRENARQVAERDRQMREGLRPEQDPIYNPGEGLTKYAHDFTRMIPQIATQIGTTLATGPAGGMTFMATQIAGPQYDELVKKGVPKEKAATAAMMNAIGQVPLEQIGLGKAMSATNGKKIAGAMLTEWLTETMQKNPELASNIWAEGKGTPGEKLTQFMQQWPQAMKEGAYEGLVAAPFGGMVATAATAANKFQHDDLPTARVSPEQSLEVPPSVKPVVVGTPAQIKKLKQEGKTKGKQIYQTGGKAYVLDPTAVHDMIGADTKIQSVIIAKKRLKAGDDSQLLGKPDREGVPPEELTTAAVTREGEILTDQDAIKEQVEAGNVIEAAEGRAEDVTAQAEKVSEAIKQKSTYSSRDRRVNIEERKRFDEMTSKEQREAYFKDELTGLNNRRAYTEEINSGEWVEASVDADNLKFFNDKIGMGDAGGDLLLQVIGKTLAQATDKAYRVGGDEFAVLAKTNKDLSQAIDKANEILANTEIIFEAPDGRIFKYDKPGFSFGLGETKQEADLRLKEHKAERKKRGERAAERDERPPGLAEITPEGVKVKSERLTPKQLSQKVKVKAIEERTGKTIEIGMPAKEALADIETRRDKLSKLMDCLNS